MDGYNPLGPDIPVVVTISGPNQHLPHGLRSSGPIQGPHDNVVISGGESLSINMGNSALSLDFVDTSDLNFQDYPGFPASSFTDGITGPMTQTGSGIFQQQQQSQPHQTAQSQQYDFDQYPTFEDPFAYTRSFEQHKKLDPYADDCASPQTLDNKLLGFSDPTSHLYPATEQGVIKFGLSAELNGMFFVAEDVFMPENPTRPLELTCYRRNLWQCTGQVVLSRMLPHNFIGENGIRATIVGYSASITATESIELKATEIISVPWKSAAASAGDSMAIEEPRQSATAPPNLTLDLSSGKEIDVTFVSVPLVWKRLQFKHATANNGRRKGVQQHYVVHITLHGTTTTGETVKIMEVKSNPVIVRGRSPRNFDSRKDVPLVADTKKERKNTLASNSSLDGVSTSSRYPSATPVNLTTDLHSEYQSQPDWQSPQGFTGTPSATTATTSSRTPQISKLPSQNANNNASNHQHMAKKLALSPSQSRPPVPAWSMTPSASMPQGQYQGSANGSNSGPLPLSLSLSEDEKSPNRSGSTDVQSPKYNKAASVGNSQIQQGTEDNADWHGLYEYFPLSVDDWLPPVDAVYRPHVVHHTIVPPELKAQQMQSKSKRYFVAE